MAGMSNLRLVPPVGGPIEIAGDRTLLGRDPGADLVVNDPSVSRRHALIERRPEGWVVLDQRSANGTFVNNQRVDQAFLPAGSQLAWERLLLGESRAALEGLALRLVDHAGARARKRQVQEALSAIKRFFEEEAGALARARAATGFRPYPVPQQDRDLLFARCRARPLPA